MSIDLEYSPIEYISYQPVSKALAVTEQKRRNQRRFLYKHNKEESEDSYINDQDSIDRDIVANENLVFEPRKLFMKSRCFANIGGNHSIFLHLDQIFESCYYHHSATFTA